MDFIKGNYEWMAAVAALVVAIWAAVSAHGSKVEARKAREVAERAAGATERSARADEQMAALAQAEQAAADEALARRPWEMERLSEHRVRFTNRGPKAYDVVIGIDAQYLEVEGEHVEHSNVETGESRTVTFMLAGDNTGAVRLDWSTSEGPDAVRLEQRETL